MAKHNTWDNLEPVCHEPLSKASWEATVTLVRRRTPWRSVCTTPLQRAHNTQGIGVIGFT